jgi:starch synthase
VALYRQPAAWQRLQIAGMRADVGWQTSAAEYAALYRRLVRPQEPA